MAVLGLGIAACGDDGSGDAGAMDSGDTGSAGDDASGTADESGTEGDTSPWSSLNERPCPDDNFLSYENFGGPFVLTYCTGCHASGVPADQRQGAPLMVNFDDIEDIRSQAAGIWARAADQNETMPPVGAADMEERALLGEWLACGAPEDADLEM